MTKKIYKCLKCNNYCTEDGCYTCDDISSQPAILTDIKDTKEQDIVFIEKVFELCLNKNFQVLLSDFSDAPGHLATVSMNSQEIIEILKKQDFILNGIISVCEMSCIGIGLLETAKINSYEVNGLFVFSNGEVDLSDELNKIVPIEHFH